MRVDTEDENDEITVELVNGTLGHPVTLDSDRNIVLRIANPMTQEIRVVITHTNPDLTVVSDSTTIGLGNITLELPPNATPGPFPNWDPTDIHEKP